MWSCCFRSESHLCYWVIVQSIINYYVSCYWFGLKRSELYLLFMTFEENTFYIWLRYVLIDFNEYLWNKFVRPRCEWKIKENQFWVSVVLALYTLPLIEPTREVLNFTPYTGMPNSQYPINRVKTRGKSYINKAFPNFKYVEFQRGKHWSKNCWMHHFKHVICYLIVSD